MISAGNTFPQALEAFQSKAFLDFNAIIVGSFSPLGFVSRFSQEGKEVWVLASSDNYISSLDSHGEYSQFGGISGATPLVTGIFQIIGGEEGLSLLKLMAEDESKEVGVMLARSSFWIGSSLAMSLFESICRQKDFLIKQELIINWYTFEQVWELCNKQLLHKDKQ